jgi:hypothetical protein
MYKTVSGKMQSRARSVTRVPVSDWDRKINAKVAKRNAEHKQRLADAIAQYRASYSPKN